MKLKHPPFLFLVIAISACSSLDLKEYDSDISSDELFASDRLSYRYKNEILVKEPPKEEKENEKQERTNTEKQKTSTVIYTADDNDNFNNFKVWRKSNPDSNDYEDYLIWLEYQRYLNKTNK